MRAQRPDLELRCEEVGRTRDVIPQYSQGLCNGCPSGVVVGCKRLQMEPTPTAHVTTPPPNRHHLRMLSPEWWMPVLDPPPQPTVPSAFNAEVCGHASR